MRCVLVFMQGSARNLARTVSVRRRLLVREDTTTTTTRTSSDAYKEVAMKEEKEREGGRHCNEMRGNQIKGGGGQQPWRQKRASSA